MREGTCELCGQKGGSGTANEYHIVPSGIIEQAGITAVQTVRLCHNCHSELQRWYSIKVTDMAYDIATKQFRAKPYLEVVKEYHDAFNAFAKYKQERIERS